MRDTVRWTLGGAAAVLGAAAVAFLVHEKMVERPRYEVVEEDGSITVRRYPELLVVETVARGDRKTALGEGFNRLAAFIFAKDRPDGDGRRIAMTAPVLSDHRDGGWRTRFIMPTAFTRETLPRRGADVDATVLPSRLVAAIRYAGSVGDAALREHEKRLRDWLGAHHKRAAGPAEHAFYDSPFMPAPLRRNEVLIPLEG